MEGSSKIYHEGMVNEDSRQSAWLKDSWDSRIDIYGDEADAYIGLAKSRGDAAVETAEINARSLREQAHYEANALNYEASMHDANGVYAAQPVATATPIPGQQQETHVDDTLDTNIAESREYESFR